MKKLAIGLILAVLLGTCSLNIYADRDRRNPGGHGPGPGPGYSQGPKYSERDDAKYTINRTAHILSEAQRVAKQSRKNFRSGLGLASAHQERALDLYRRGDYREAINHSLRARRLAFQILDNNRQRYGGEYRVDNREDYYSRRGPGDSDLDRRLDRGRVRNDDDVIRIFIKFDL